MAIHGRYGRKIPANLAIIEAVDGTTGDRYRP
jgi:hypothetical protein